MQPDVGFSSLITSAMRDGFLRVDPDGRILDVNEALCRMTGFAREELVGTGPPYPFWADGDWHVIFLEWGPDTDLPLRRKDGSHIPTGFTGSSVGGADGTRAGYFAIVQDRSRQRLAEERLRLIAEATSGVIFDWDLRGGRIDRSAGLADLLGLAPQEAEPTHEWWVRRIHPDDLPLLRDTVQGILGDAGPRLYSAEYRVRHRDGTYRWVRSRGVALRDAHGRAVRVVGTHADVTKRKLAEEGLRASEERLRAMFEQTTAGIGQLDLRGRFIFVNKWLCDLIGYSREELLSMRMQDITHPDDVARNLRHLDSAKSEGGPGSYLLEKRYLRKDGAVVWVNVSGNVIRDGRGDPQSVLGVITDITERKRAEEAGRMSEFRFRRLVEQSPLSTQIFAPDGTVRQVNRAWEKLFGVTLTDLPDYNILSDPQLTRRGVAPLVRRAFVGEAVTIDPIPYVPGQGQYAGETLWCGAYVYPVKDDAGNVVEVVLVHNNVTEQKRAEEALRAATERWELAVRATQDGIWDWDLTGEGLYWSPRCKEMVGYADDELPMTRDAVRELMHPDDRARGWAETQRHLAGETPFFQCEYRLRHRDGSYRWVLARGVALRDGRGRPVRMIGSHTDITPRKRSEEALARSTERLELAQRAAHIGVFDWDVQSGAVVWTEQEERLFGLEPGTFEGDIDGWMKRVVPEDAARVKEEMSRAMNGGQRETDFAFRIVRPDGSVRWIEGSGRIMYDEHIRPVRMVGVNVDVTERRRLEEERAGLLAAEQKARSEAEAASKAKDQFLAVLSHELRTPLTPVLATVDALGGDPDLPPRFAEDLSVIRRNVELEARLIDDIIDITRIARGKVQLHHEAVDVHASLRHAMEICQGEIDAKGLEVSLVLRARRHVVWADPTRFQQILWNVVNNAVKFTPREGRVTLRTADADDGRLLIQVSDTGVGIAPEVLPRLFNAFEQGERTVTRRFGGLGLGLTITKALVEMHGGEIGASSDGTDRGATFTLHFAPAASPPTGAAPASGRTGAARRAGAALRILLVEDNEDTLKVMARVLRSLGYGVETATGVRDALALAERERFDLLISDIGLPDGSGWDVMRELGRKQSLRGIALSGYGLDDDLRKSREAGFELHLTKPVSFQTLQDVIQKVSSPGGAADT